MEAWPPHVHQNYGRGMKFELMCTGTVMISITYLRFQSSDIFIYSQYYIGNENGIQCFESSVVEWIEKSPTLTWS